MNDTEFDRPTPSRSLLKNLVFNNIFFTTNDDEGKPVDHITVATALNIDPALVKELCDELVEDGLLVDVTIPEED